MLHLREEMEASTLARATVSAELVGAEASTVMDLRQELEDRDQLFFDAALVCIRAREGTTSLLQRRLQVGYGRAARLIDQLHSARVLGPPDGSKPRRVLMDEQQLTALRGV
jgi:S-DNA-T family DNA segregation ATPase FtsK/SpoIIIE